MFGGTPSKLDVERIGTFSSLQALEMEPSLSRHIVGAWWFPQDMSIDAQRMFGVLELACLKAGVEILQG